MNMISKLKIDYSQDFVTLSGDNNPLHTDSLYSRRIMFGRPVIHGVYSLLKIFDFYSNSLPCMSSLISLEAKFLNPIFDGDSIVLKLDCNEDDYKIQAYLEETKLIIIKLKFSSVLKQNLFFENTNKLPQIEQPKKLILENISKINGNEINTVNTNLFNTIFNSLDANKAPQLYSTLLTSTRVVGVKCPGADSLYSSLNLHFATTSFNNNLFEYNVNKVYKGLSLIKIDFKSLNYVGTINAFLRKQEVQQKSLKNILQDLTKVQYPKRKALVIGGTRGLGEVCAKILGSLGYETSITYNKGIKEAKRISNEFKENNLNLTFFQYNVLDSKKDFLKDKVYDYIFFFATPHIKTSNSQLIDNKLLDYFNNFYLNGFFSIVNSIKNKKTRFFFPSSVFIDEFPKYLKEYAISKKISEYYSEQYNKQKGVKIIHYPRLKKVKTDQTQDFFNSDSLDAYEELKSNLIKFLNETN